MKDFYLVSYSVKGIKTLEDLVTLSFYKKTISKNPDTQEYNIKGIYGMNGSGKTGIITSMDILKNLIANPGYLSNPIVQNNLEAIINKKTKSLFVEVEFLATLKDALVLFKYSVTLSKDDMGKYVISHEKLSSKKATSRSTEFDMIFEVSDGKIVYIVEGKNDNFNDIIFEKSINLLSANTMSGLFFEKIVHDLMKKNKKYDNLCFEGLFVLLLFGRRVHVYLDKADDHREFFVRNMIGWTGAFAKADSEVDAVLKSFVEMDDDFLKVVSADENFVPKTEYKKFEETVRKLYTFISIFKSDLQDIEIEKKEDENLYVCNLVMVYDSYKVHAEFESTGIKKLIKLFAYLTEMVQGDIVFIDEFDSNLHDVYLCALLEYLIEYGKGQLCFTTHNVGPMDILKRNKMSIDFLSEDNKIYSWKTNGNYSPSKLYRNGMIEGSPFNVDSIDFIGVFDSSEEGE